MSRPAPKCSRKTCTRRARTIGYCTHHYNVWRRENGDYYVPAQPAIAHINKLREAGTGWKTIHDITGVGIWALRDIVRRNARCRRDTAEKILAIPLPRLHTVAPDDALIDSIGTVRRLRALTAIGYSGMFLAGELGMLKSHVCSHIQGEQKYVRASTARRVEELFQRLHMVPGPDDYGGRRARLRAERKGWAPPMAWDDLTIDDPSASPFVGEKLSRREDFERALEDAAVLDLSQEQIADRLGVSVDALRKRAKRVFAA